MGTCPFWVGGLNLNHRDQQRWLDRDVIIHAGPGGCGKVTINYTQDWVSQQAEWLVMDVTSHGYREPTAVSNNDPSLRNAGAKGANGSEIQGCPDASGEHVAVGGHKPLESRALTNSKRGA